MSTEPIQPWPESMLRDHLAAHLALIEPDLDLVKVEHHLSNPDGADGKIDILARDPSGDLVVIELKRSDQTARQALHELTKYVSLLAEAHGIPVHKLRCILLSTTWHELSVPFARFKATIDFAVDGLALTVDEDGGPSSVIPVVAPSVPAGIEACPLHALLMWDTDDQRSTGLQDLQAAAAEIGIADYFVFTCDRDPEALPSRTPYGAYLVLGSLDLEHGMLVEQSCSEHLEEVDDEYEWKIEEVALTGLLGRLSLGDLDLSRPDEFVNMRDSWSITGHVAAGRYANDLVWPQQRLEAAAAAMADRHGSSFARILRPEHAPNWSRGCTNLLECLTVAPPWREITERLLSSIAAHPDAKVRVGAFCPANMLGALDYLFRGEQGDVLPIVKLQYQHTDIERHVVGTLIWDGTEADSLEAVITSVYDSVEDYFLWSSIVPDADHRLCAALGLQFEMIEFEPGDSVPRRLRPDGTAGLTREHFDMDAAENRSVSEFMEAHDGFLLELALAFDHYTWRPGIPRLEDLVDLSRLVDERRVGEASDDDF